MEKYREVTDADVIEFLNRVRPMASTVQESKVNDIFEEYDEDESNDFIDYLDDGKDREGLFFSKALTVASLAIYFFIVGVVLLLSIRCIDMAKEGITANLSSISTALAAMISVPIALPCTCVVSYLKKTQAGHTGKVMGMIYRDAADKELECKLILMEKQAELKLDDKDISKATISRIDNITTSAFNDMNSAVKNTMNDAISVIKKETGV